MRKARAEKRYAERRNFILNFKAQVGCQQDSCIESNPLLLEFHHPNGRKEKERRASSDLSWREIFKLCKECEVLCLNHHAIKHREKFI